MDGIIVKVSPQISGIITEMYVEEGDLLQKGALIARQVDYTLSPDANPGFVPDQVAHQRHGHQKDRQC